jgi:hypothetical protein
MATVYNIKIRTVSPFINYSEKYMTKMFEKFLKEYEDLDTSMKFESTEIHVERL